MKSYGHHTALNRPENIMMRTLPLGWAALHLGLASAATYLLIASDVLAEAAPFLIR